MNKRKRLGDILIEANYITNIELEEALKFQKITRKKLGEIFIEKGIISENDLLNVLEKQLEIPRVNLEDINIDNKAVALIPESLAKKYNVIPVMFEDGKLVLVMNDPLNVLAEEDVAIASGYMLKIVLATKKEIKEAIAKCYSENYMIKTAQEYTLQEKEAVPLQSDLTDEEIKNSPAVKLVDNIIENAVRSKASDIHIEPFRDKFSVRYRIDGYLHKQFESSKEPLGAMITRVKIMASMDIAEKRIPQDGRIFTKVDGEEVDLRVSILPTVNGEKIVMRILDKEAFMLDKETLGIVGNNADLIDKIISKPYGIVLVTGPTGSGKTTTLYSILKELNSEDRNIITVEDPVEYTIDNINQVSVNSKSGLTFASGLRAILRQDPDIIMIGEIRDSETAEIATRAAITGHLVLSTIHTNDAASSVVRLKDMGIEPYLVASSLMGVISQRLIRKLCPHCKEKYKANDYEKEILGLHKESDVFLYKRIGCTRCSGSGYKGRVGVYEVMEVNNSIRSLIYSDGSVEEIRKVAVENGLITLYKSAVNVVLSGESTIEELMRVTLLGE